MARDYLAIGDGEFFGWAKSFATAVHQSPSTYFISEAQAENLWQLYDAFAQAYMRACNPGTRTRGAISDKNDTRDRLKAEARRLAQLIRVNPQVSNDLLVSLSLAQRNTSRTKIAKPTEAPNVYVVQAIGRRLKLKLRASHSIGRAKPDGVRSANVMSYVGDQPPADLNQWTLHKGLTRLSAWIQFPPTVRAGAQVWISAYWLNPRDQRGPASAPVSAYVAGGVAQAA